MGRPRKYKRQEIRKKCQTCGKFTNFPYIHTTVPSFYDLAEIVPWTRGAEKIPRTSLRGDRKVHVSYHCDSDCFDEYRSL